MIEQVDSEVDAAIESQLGLLQNLATQHHGFAPFAERYGFTTE